MRSVPPPREPSQPASEIRTSYQVGRPWIFEGKMLRGVAGTPMRRIARANSRLALAEPEPFTLAKRTTKSLTLRIGLIAVLTIALPSPNPLPEGEGFFSPSPSGRGPG